MEVKCDEITYTPEIFIKSETTTESSLPDKSKKAYESVYKAFMDWRSDKEADSFSEVIVLAYFEELSKKYKVSSLWTQYSMLRSTLESRHSIKLDTYAKLRAFLKQKSDGYEGKKAKIFTPEQIKKFIENADDQKYLATKVALIMGIMGACKCNEIKEMNIKDLQDFSSAVLVNIPSTKTRAARNFTITGNFYEIVKKYISLRPEDVKCSSFFLNYQNGKCTGQGIGINKFSLMGKQIATFLNLPNPELYTGHSFRRSSATLFVDADGDIIGRKRHGAWKSITVIQEGIRIDEPRKNNVDTCQSSFQSSFSNTSNSETANLNITKNVTTPYLNITNCSNFTVHFHPSS